MTQIMLTIGIPTFNGAKHIKQTIDSVLSQLQLADIDESSIEILINDNASDDNVWQIANAYKEEFPALFSIFQNEVNVGFDRNVDLVFKRSRGEFVWPLADDDIILPGGLKKVVEAIKSEQDISLVFVGGATNINCAGVICTNGNKFLNDSEFRSGGVSANIIRRSTWNLMDVSKYFDSGWVHFGVVIEVVSQNRAYIFRDVLIAEPLGLKKKWGAGGSFLLVGLELIKLFKNMKTLGYESACIKNAHYKIKGSYSRQIIKAKAHGLVVTTPLIVNFVKLFYTFPSFWLIDLPLLLMPQKLSWLIYQGYRLIRSRSTVSL
jgi:glycosyltransferase involved in cell wall biosynthesis